MTGPGNQSALPGMDAKGERRMAEARAWVDANHDEWTWYLRNARQECRRTHDGKASPNRALYGMRIAFSIELPNHMAPYLARIAMEQDPSIRMRVARSDADLYTTARLS